jgi:hypothetical protein
MMEEAKQREDVPFRCGKIGARVTLACPSILLGGGRRGLPWDGICAGQGGGLGTSVKSFHIWRSRLSLVL